MIETMMIYDHIKQISTDATDVDEDEAAMQLRSLFLLATSVELGLFVRLMVDLVDYGGIANIILVQASLLGIRGTFG